MQVSVVMPAYNGARHIAEAIKSICVQTRPPAEVVVVDDCSTDETTAVVEAAARRAAFPVRVIRLPANSGGPAGPLNRGVEEARGDVIAFLDQDDVMHAERIAKGVDLLQRHSSAALMFGQYQRINAEGDLLPSHNQLYDHLEGKSLLSGDEVLLAMARYGYFYGGAGGMMLRKQAWHDLGRFNPDFRMAWDFEFAIRAARSGREVAYYPGVIYSHRIHDKNLDSCSPRQKAERIRLLVRMALMRRLPAAARTHAWNHTFPDFLSSTEWEMESGSLRHAFLNCAVGAWYVGDRRGALCQLGRLPLGAVRRACRRLRQAT